MRLIDPHGRFLGLINVIDAAIVLTVCALAAIGYHLLASQHRILTPQGLARDTVWVRTELQLPSDRRFLFDTIKPGLKQPDLRTGAPVAEVSGCQKRTDGSVLVTLRLSAARDPQGHLFYDGRRLVPGRPLTIETQACIIKGLVTTAQPESTP